MANNKKQKASESVQNKAQELAKANQRPGQSKEQTKLVAQGIAKGIEQYKKQQKSRKRELDKKSKKLDRQLTLEPEKTELEVVVRQHWLPWGLLVISWFAFVVVYFMGIDVQS